MGPYVKELTRTERAVACVLLILPRLGTVPSHSRLSSSTKTGAKRQDSSYPLSCAGHWGSSGGPATLLEDESLASSNRQSKVSKPLMKIKGIVTLAWRIFFQVVSRKTHPSYKSFSINHLIRCRWKQCYFMADYLRMQRHLSQLNNDLSIRYSFINSYVSGPAG